MRKSIILLAFILGGFTAANAQSVVELSLIHISEPTRH